VRSFSTNSRPALRAASGRPPARQPHGGHRGTGLTHPAPAYSQADGDTEVHSTWLLDTHRRVRSEPAHLRLGLTPDGPRAQHRRPCDLLAPDPLQRRRVHRDSHAPTNPPTEVACRLWTRGLGAHLGHALVGSRGQPRSPRDPPTWPLTCVNADDLDSAGRHAVYGMQGVRGSNPLSSTRHNASSISALSAICQRFARKRGLWPLEQSRC
jgi:hypothetical protein